MRTKLKMRPKNSSLQFCPVLTCCLQSYGSNWCLSIGISEVLNVLLSFFSMCRPRQLWRAMVKTMSMALFTFIPMKGKCWCWSLMWTMKTGGMPKLLTWRLFYIRQSWQIQNQYSSTSRAKYFHQGKEIRMLVENYRVFWDTNLNVTTFLWLQQGHWVNASPSVFPIIEILLLFLFHNLV